MLDALEPRAIPAAIAHLAARLLTEPPPTQPPLAPTGRLLTPDEAAARLGVARRWVYRHQEQLKAVPLSKRKLRIPEAAVERVLAGKRPLSPKP